MAHPVVGIWQVELELDGQLTHVTHAYHPDGIMHLDAGEHGASLLWEPTGDRTFRFRGTRPVEPDLYRFLGWAVRRWRGGGRSGWHDLRRHGADDRAAPRRRAHDATGDAAWDTSHDRVGDCRALRRAAPARTSRLRASCKTMPAVARASDSVGASSFRP
jgi:hypothetical protein